GRAVAAHHPERAAEVLAVIEEAATRTLAEMRAIVGALRTEPGAELVPQAGLGDVAGLATSGPSGLRVEVAMDGDLDGLSPVVGAAVFRLAQEAVTNARRHARQATRVTVAVTGEPDQVRLTVEDDG